MSKSHPGHFIADEESPFRSTGLKTEIRKFNLMSSSRILLWTVSFVAHHFYFHPVATFKITKTKFGILVLPIRPQVLSSILVRISGLVIES